MAGTERKKTTATKKKLACKYCSMVCSTRYSLDEHVRTHTGDRPFLCNLCNTSFKRMMGLRKHQQCVHGAPGLKQYNCPQCKLVSPNLGNVLRHYLVVHKTLRRFICSICLVQYNQNQELKSHLSAKHSIAIGNINSKEKKSICEIYVLPTFDPKDRPNTIITRLKEMVEAEKEKLVGIEKLISVIKNNTETGDTRSICVAANSSSTDVVESSDVISDTINESDHNNEKTNIEERIQLSRTPEEEMNNDNCPETWISFVLEKPTILYNEICYENCIPSEIFLDDEQGNSRINKPAAELTVQKTEWKCDVCQKTFPEEKRLCRHLKMHNNSEAKSKLQNIKSNYMREKIKLTVIKTGSAAESTPVNWPYFSIMSFVDNSMQYNKTVSSVPDVSFIEYCNESEHEGVIDCEDNSNIHEPQMSYNEYKKPINALDESLSEKMY